MDVIVSAVGDFVWAASCAIINFCVSSGFSATAVFVSFLCVILASAFYKYSSSHEPMSTDNLPCDSFEHEDDEKSSSTTEQHSTETDEANPVDNVQSLSEIDVRIEESANEAETNNMQTSDGMLIDTVEGSEEEIQKQQIANIYRLLNDQQLINNWTTTDFLDQLRMYGLQPSEEDEPEFS